MLTITEPKKCKRETTRVRDAKSNEVREKTFPTRQQQIQYALDDVNREYGKTLKNLAK